MCNVPNKAHFNPTEQMIVAYHKGTIVCAYKGIFNYNMDHHWSGAILYMKWETMKLIGMA